MEPLLPKHGGYRNLVTFKLARLIYDITERFCNRFIDKKSRTHDQMVQAARSGVQNIAEGSQISGTSKKIELKLTNIARGSLEELRLDYEDFLRHRCLHLWEFADQRRKQLVSLRINTADEFALWAKTLDEKKMGTLEEIAANGTLALISAACSLLDRQIESQAKTFQQEGGFTERLYAMRSRQRRK